MATSGGGGRRSPPAATAAPSRVVMDSLMEVQEGATRLQTMLQESPTPSIAAAAAGTIDGMMSSLSSAMSALDTTGGGGGGAGQGQGRRRRRGGGAGAAAGSGPQRRSSTRRRSHSPYVNTVTASTLNDGKSWRKYGQKLIQESPNNPRSYYRCTHRPDQNCRATRQVQASDANPSEFIISYFGEHTCQDPSTIPLVIPDDDTAPPPDCANFISFGGGGSTTAGGGAPSTTAVPPQTLSFDPTTTAMSFLPRFGYSCSLPAPAPAQQEDHRCGSEEALSSCSPPPAAPLAAAVVGVGSAGTMTSSSVTTVGSAPAEYWPAPAGAGSISSDMVFGGAGTGGSFPSSPSSLGFMTGSPFGSFGNAGDDDLFGFDP